MKILVITGLHPKANDPMSSIFITRRLISLKAKGIDFDVFSLYVKEVSLYAFIKKLLRRTLNRYPDYITVEGITYIFIPVKVGLLDKLLNYRIDRLRLRAIKEIVDFDLYDLIHAHWVYPDGYLATLIKAETGLPCVITAHGSDIHTRPVDNIKIRALTNQTLKNADRAIFVSEKLFLKSTELGYEGGNHRVIYSGVDTSLFLPVGKELARNKLGLSGLKTKYIGFVGNLKTIKGADKLPGIFYQIAQLCDDASFIIVGDGELRVELEKHFNDTNLRVYFTGQLDAGMVSLYMNAMDVLVIPSRQEGLGCVIFEAQACGCPVVGSSAGGIPEAIGDGGIVVAHGPNFELNMAKAVCEILKCPLPIDKLRKRAVINDWSLVVDKEIEVYQEVL